MKSFHAVLRYVVWLFLLAVAVGVSLQNWPGFRTMPAVIVSRRAPYGIDYDANYEAKLNSSKPMPAFVRQGLEMNRQYDDTLSQPIAITGWQGDVATWEIFFATNRGAIPATAESRQARFGNQVVLKSPHYGRAQIIVPWHRRGEDPNRGEPSATNLGRDKTVSFEEVRMLSWEAMAQGVQSQISRSRQHDLLLFVHGFNVDFESALIRTAQISMDIPFNEPSSPTVGPARAVSSTMRRMRRSTRARLSHLPNFSSG